jgi:hypothetical protein
MKIEGPNKTNNTSPVKKAGEVLANDAGMFSGLMATDEAEASAPPAATRQIAALDTLLAVQAAEDPGQKTARKRMAARAEDILGVLDDLRGAILVGRLTVGHMIDVADVVASHRDRIHDPHLTAVLDEIDLRAQVEIAKMRVALHHLS